MNENEDKLYSYYMVQFTGCKNSEGKFFVEIVPISWVFFNDGDKVNCTVKYSRPPYKIHVAHPLVNMVKYKLKPHVFWNAYSATILDALGNNYF